MNKTIKVILLAALTLNTYASSYCASWITRWSQTSTYETGKWKFVTERVMTKVNYEDNPTYMTRTTEYFDGIIREVNVVWYPFDTPIQNQDWTWISPDRNTQNSVSGRTQIKIKNLTSNTVFQRLYIYGSNVSQNGQPTGVMYYSCPGFFVYPFQTFISYSPWTSWENFNGGYYELNNY